MKPYGISKEICKYFLSAIKLHFIDFESKTKIKNLVIPYES